MEGVHIRLDADEALFTKKELLSSEMSALELLKRVQTYRALRSKEFIVHGRMKKAVLDLKKDVADLQISMPKQDVHKKHMKLVEELYRRKSHIKDVLKEIPAEEEKKKKDDKKGKKKIKKMDLTEIEAELKSVKEQLASLE